MALQRYVLTADVSLAAGTPATPVAGEANTYTLFGSNPVNTAAGETAWPANGSLLTGTVIVLDPAGALYAQIGSGNLRAFVDGQDDVGHAALSN
jgi:hypothetical protein